MEAEAEACYKEVRCRRVGVVERRHINGMAWLECKWGMGSSASVTRLTCMARTCPPHFALLASARAWAWACPWQVIKAHPDYDRAYVNLGGLYYVQGDLEKAAAAYVKALETNPENAIARHALGALQGEKLDGASLDYLAQLFDSYSATFDASLHALEYRSPELLRRAVDAFLATPAGKPLRPSKKKGACRPRARARVNE